MIKLLRYRKVVNNYPANWVEHIQDFADENELNEWANCLIKIDNQNNQNDFIKEKEIIGIDLMFKKLIKK